MQKIEFAEALDSILAVDPRYHREAYIFLRDALDFTIKQKKKNKETASNHVSGPELLEGVRQFALKEFGPMLVTVFEFWGVQRCEDIGEMVFNLIRLGVFGKTERDAIEDFGGGYSFKEAFIDPFGPPKKASAEVKPAAAQAAQKLK